MPTDAAPPPATLLPPPSSLKCTICGGPPATSSASRLLDTADGVCAGCVRLGFRGVRVDGEDRGRGRTRSEQQQEDDGGGGGVDRVEVDLLTLERTTILPPPAVACPPPPPPPSSQAVDILSPSSTANTSSNMSSSTRPFHPSSLPTQPTRPWGSSVPLPHLLSPSSSSSSKEIPTTIPEDPPARPAASSSSSATANGPSSSSAKSADNKGDGLPNPLLDFAKGRAPSMGRGALYPGSIFRGTQTSGRSAYEVEVRFLDVSFPTSTLSGYLSISHLTDSHPHLTTFFTAEIIGPHYGFVTGTRYGATEHDDMRHWGRFEQFRRPATRQDMVRPELFLRDPLPDRMKGESVGKERDFVFLRIKERFLVPDHKVRDISGASFAGFYFAMVDFAPPPPTAADLPPQTPTSPSIPKSPLMPTNPRRMSSSGVAAAAAGEPRSPSTSAPRRRRQSSGGFGGAAAAGYFDGAVGGGAERARGEATIRGYYFHSLNQEPFQELFLTHVPQRSAATYEMR